MVAFTEEPGRETRVYGTKGEIRCRSTEEVELLDFITKQATVFKAPALEDSRDYTGHGSSSFYMLEAFVSALRQKDPSLLLSGPEIAMKSHQLVFAAEQSRRRK